MSESAPTGMTLSEALGQAPPPPMSAPTSSSGSPMGGMSLSEAMGKKSAAPVETKPGFLVKGAKVAFTDARDFWTKFTDDVVEQQKSGKDIMSRGVEDIRNNYGADAGKGLGETLL